MRWILSIYLFGFLPDLLFACGPEWTYIGNPTSAVLCIQRSQLNPDQFLAGTYRASGVPGSGGVFRYTGQDTTWENSGLVDRRVYGLERFENRSGELFASTSWGLYRSFDDGITWDSVFEDRGGFFELHAFSISPFSSSEWIAGWSDDQWVGVLLISHDAGSSWQIIYVGSQPLKGIPFSRHLSGFLYFADALSLGRLNTVDSTVNFLYSFHDNDILSVAVHSELPWIYFMSQDSLMRYDEISGQFTGTRPPLESEHFNNFVIVSGRGLLVTTSTHIYLVNDVLTDWISVGSGLPSENGRAYYASSEAWIIQTRNPLYCRTPYTSAGNVREHPVKVSFSIFPNPANGKIYIQAPFACRMDLFNILSQKVYSGILEQPQNLFPVEATGFPSGTYFVRITGLTPIRQEPLTATFQIIK